MFPFPVLSWNDDFEAMICGGKSSNKITKGNGSVIDNMLEGQNFIINLVSQNAIQVVEPGEEE